ncbi:MAG: 3-dehydroquinate dehydratase [Alphaproteobacteria bacterium MarineAlpha9_Bin5]|nr:MAG: 3-dehydroquinate dehydratase [Alphaproteobacteria bacterium MarineAlpha9_Bin6]PPR37578.1 MAG: 3-dehydroquinate dehydratase [Alphaproteobacteria bacterium MarineAlpha9_Bin5]
MGGAMTKLLLIQGANMAWLGRRQPEIYGTTTADQLNEMLQAHADEHDYDLDIFYTHVEGEAIGRVFKGVEEGIDGLVMNPAGFTYRGEALRDCILDCEGLPYIEVHISNLAQRGIKSVLASAADGMLMGFGLQSYLLALDAMLDLLQKRNG